MDVEYGIDVVLMIVLILLPIIGRRGSAPAQTRYIQYIARLGIHILASIATRTVQIPCRVGRLEVNRK